MSRGVEISIAGGGGEMVCGPISWSNFLFFFFFFFFYIMYLLFMVQELACSASYGIKKTLNPNTCPLHLFMGKIRHAESIAKIPLA